MPGLVIFLHGWLGNEASWGNVPNAILNSPLGSDFDVISPEYSAKLFSATSIETSADQILTVINTDYPDHDPVFLVGHSLGGLIARDICRHLLASGANDALLNKIPAVITLGTPLDWARFGNTLVQYVPLLSRKVRQLASPSYAFDEYEKSIKISEGRKVRRPKQLHIQIEDDRVIAGHIDRHFTVDDSIAGTIRGSHRNFANDEKSAAFVARLLLKLLREAHNAIGKPFIKPEAEVQEADLPDQLILMACSRGKREGGQSPFPGPNPIDWLKEPQLRQRAISRRSHIYSLVVDGKLVDGMERGGNRAHQPSNKGLVRGPDLGGASIADGDGQYFAAHHRYNGRIYLPVAQQAWDSVLANKARVRVLIMSGLYGLIEPDEQIQNYDVHLTDTDVPGGVSVSAMWSELFTDMLNSYIRHAKRDRKVRIVNLLCDHHYTNSIQWHALLRDCSVFHLASPTIEDVELLPPAGLVLNSLLSNPDQIQTLERDQRRYPLSDFGEVPLTLGGTELIFESRVGLSKRNAPQGG